jgi:hypothetical protein
MLFQRKSMGDTSIPYTGNENQTLVIILREKKMPSLQLISLQSPKKDRSEHKNNKACHQTPLPDRERHRIYGVKKNSLHSEFFSSTLKLN